MGDFAGNTHLMDVDFTGNVASGEGGAIALRFEMLCTHTAGANARASPRDLQEQPSARRRCAFNGPRCVARRFVESAHAERSRRSVHRQPSQHVRRCALRIAGRTCGSAAPSSLAIARRQGVARLLACRPVTARWKSPTRCWLETSRRAAPHSWAKVPASSMRRSRIATDPAFQALRPAFCCHWWEGPWVRSPFGFATPSCRAEPPQRAERLTRPLRFGSGQQSSVPRHLVRALASRWVRRVSVHRTFRYRRVRPQMPETMWCAPRLQSPAATSGTPPAPRCSLHHWRRRSRSSEHRRTRARAVDELRFQDPFAVWRRTA